MDMQQIRLLRDTIDGEINRIAISNDADEIQKMHDYLLKNIERYTQANLNDRLTGTLAYEPTEGGSQNLKF